MSKIKAQNKRAFTLTELLIVVIVIGVLSAVTLPKFNRVIENRKVTEAEEMMSAVRMEQERRCSLDQNYTTNFSNLSDVIASANTKNYTYSLQSQGISAKSASGDYTLKILSYEDGSYCCTGEGCKKLNKNYPDCATLSFPASNCAGTEGGGEPGEPGTDPGETPECADGQVQGSQACNGCGVQTTQKCVGGKWTNVLGTCSKTAEECTVKPQCPTKPADAVKQCECGTVTASHKCDASTNYTWVQEAFPSCPTKPADVTETCSDGKTVRTKTFTCVNNVWTAGDWDKECPEENACNSDARTYWNATKKRCECPQSNQYYHKGECCSNSTPKSNTTCWTLKTNTTEWVALERVMYSQLSKGDPTGQCALGGDGRYGLGASGWDFGNVGVPSGLLACSRTTCDEAHIGTRCISSCSVRLNDISGNVGSGVALLYYYDLNWQECRKTNKTSYVKNWSSTFDTRYSCGHEFILPPKEPIPDLTL